MSNTEFFKKKAEEALVGRTIVGVKYMSEEDVNFIGWSESALIIILDNDETIIPSKDSEGNDAGCYFLSKQTIPSINLNLNDK
jgi:hypothetical protein